MRKTKTRKQKMKPREKENPGICDTCGQPIKSDGIVMIVGESICWECLKVKYQNDIIRKLNE